MLTSGDKVAVPATSRVIDHLKAFLASHRAYLWTVVLYAAVLGLLGLVTPIAVQALVNMTAFGTVLQPILVLALLVLTGLVLSGILRALKSWAVEVLQRRMFMDTVARLAYVLPRADRQAVRQAGIEQPSHRFFELFSVQKATSSLLLTGIDAVLAALVGLLVLAFYHPVLLAFDVVLVAALAVVVFVLGRGGVPTAVAESTAKYHIASFFTEMERAPLSFRDASGEKYACEVLDCLCSDYLDERERHYRVVFRQLLGALTLQAVASAALLGLGGFLVLKRELTLGQLVAAELIVAVVVGAFSDLGKHLETYYDLTAGLYKLDRALDLPMERDLDQLDGQEPRTGPARVVVSDLTLRTGVRAVLDGASVTLEPGSRSQLLGVAESGKTSFLDVLYGVRRAEHGAVMLDGRDTREMSREELRSRVAIVRGPEVLPGTIIDNVRLAMRNVSAGKVRATLDKLELLEELSRLPDGLDTVLGPAGHELSYSQAWRLTLARAMVKSPGLLAIDAEFSSIDARVLEHVLDAVARPDAPWTLLVVGESDVVRAHCNQTVRLESGHLSQGAKS
jgi:putative ABC transport system ATP-binding protein